jgi:DNA-binding NtrC family response regulator
MTLPGILVVEDESTLANNIKTYLDRHGFDVRVADNGGNGLQELERFKPDIVLLDINLPDLNGLEVLARIRSHDARIKVIVITGERNVQVAVSAMKAGAHDYMSKPLILNELKLLLEKATGQQRMEGALNYYQKRDADGSGLSRLLGESAPMRLLKQKINQLLEAEQSLTDGPPTSVLVCGETGTGKELVARALHFNGPRRDKPFVTLNCGAIPINLLEAELFGYEKGAFTDARERKTGLAEAADGGTLFLDEIGDVEPSSQVKLLKLLEDRVVRRLGGTRELAVDVRIVSATNIPLETAVQSGNFRADLYFRLKVLQLELPPLRSRGKDILLLAEYFLADQCKRYHKKNIQFSSAAKEALLSYAWPGNVRELRNCVENAVLLAQAPLIEPGNLAFTSNISQARDRSGVEPSRDSHGFPNSGINLEEYEWRLMAQALEKTQGNVSRAAKLLGITRDTLRYRIEKHGNKLLS